MGWSFSSDEFNEQWRFCIDKDFVTHDGEEYEYAESGLQEWGDESLKIPYSYGPAQTPHGSLSDDGKYIAVAVKYKIQIFELASGQLKCSLVGHTAAVSCVRFWPGSSNRLVSSAEYPLPGDKLVSPQIIFWDIEQYMAQSNVKAETVERVVRDTANTVIGNLKLEYSEMPFNADDQKDFAKAITEPLEHLLANKVTERQHQMCGRLAGSFQSQVFSQSGRFMVYMPGKAPRSNGDDDWEVRVYDPHRQADDLTLSGNRDSVVWAGFNRDESLIATASWDKSFRIWDTKDGTPKFIFWTEQQNWTGGFSPNGKFFVGTSGDSKMHVYNLSDGSEHMVFDAGGEWVRCLDWHPSSRYIALGGEVVGKIDLIDVVTKETVQTRLLSTSATRYPEELVKPDPGRTFLVTTGVRFVDRGNKLAFFTSGDGSAEVYDILRGEKWRFARAGTMNGPDDDSKVTSKSGYDMVVNEDHANRKVVLATFDGDGVRVWSVPMTE